MATLADVAALARVSKATASRAFNRPHTVSPATAQRVFDASAALNFVANPAARQLARGRTGIIALIVPTLGNSYFPPIIGGAQERAQECGMQVTVSVHPLASIKELSAFEKLSRQVDGFILATPQGNDDLVHAACDFRPTVLLDRETPGHPAVIADTPTAFGELTEHLIRSGHRNIAYLGGPEYSWLDPLRAEAVRKTAGVAGADISEFGPYPPTFQAGFSACQDVLDSGATAVIPYASALGLGLEYSMLKTGIQNPPVVTSERPLSEAITAPHAYTVDVDGEELGATAVNMLISHIEDPTEPVETIKLPVPVSPANNV